MWIKIYNKQLILTGKVRRLLGINETEIALNARVTLS